MIPPNFCVEIKGTDAKKCFFCEQGKNELELIIDGKSKKYTKDECIKEYNEFLNKLKQSKGVAKILASDIKNT